MKRAVNRYDPFILLNEVLGWEFCRVLELPFAPYKLASPIEHDERADNAPIRFLSRAISGSPQTRAFEHLPSVWLDRIINKNECLGIFIFDVWADHTDRRQAIFSEEAEGLRATFIDNTHLFGGPDRRGGPRCSKLSASEIVALSAANNKENVRLWIELFRQRLPAALDRALNFLPEQWHELQRIDGTFSNRFKRRIDQLESLVENAVDRASSFEPPFRLQFFCDFHEEDAPRILPLV